MVSIENISLLFLFSEIDTAVDVGDIISALTLFTIVVSGVWALVQWNYNLRLQRSESLEKLVAKFRSEEELCEMLYRIDKNEEWYTKGFHDGKKLERQVDKLLTYLSYLCYLKENNVIKSNEFDFIKYYIDQTLRNKSTQDYLFNLLHYLQGKGMDFPFPLLLNYAKKNGFIKDDFWNEDNADFQHIMIP